MSYKIIVDLSHNEKIEEFPEFAIEEDQYEVDYLEKGPIDFESIEDYDILFMGNIQHEKTRKSDKFTPNELKAIKRFVGEGGGLFITAGRGGDQDISMTQGSLRVLYKITGVRRLWNGIVQESSSNFIVKKENVLITDFFAHPITKGITEVILPNCTFFTITEDEVDDIVMTSEKADFRYLANGELGAIGPVSICVASKFYDGRSLMIGSTEFLLEDSDFGIDAGDNQKLFKNILQWLTFEI